MSMKALVFIAVLLACLANIEAASLTASASVSWSGTVSGTVSSSVSSSVSNSLSVSSSVSNTVAASPVTTANVASFTNTCPGKPQIICLQWTSTSADHFVITMTSPSHTWTYGSNIRNVDLLGLEPSTTYVITITAVDAAGRTSATLTLATSLATTGSENPKSNPKVKGPLPNSLSCAQSGTSAAVVASWTLQSVIPNRVNLQVKCPGLRSRKVNIKPSLTKFTVAGLFGNGAAARTANCKCKLRAFYLKDDDRKMYQIPLLKSTFSLAINS